MSRWCNFRCNYCFQKHDENKPDEERFYKEAKQIASLIFRTKPIHKLKVRLSLIGGEVSHYNLVEILKPLYDKIDTLSMVTNSSGNLDTLITECVKRNIKIILNCSFHEDYYTVDNFIERVKHFISLGANCSILTVITNNNYEINKEMVDKCKLNGIKCVVNLERSADGNTEILVNKKECLELVKENEDNNSYTFTAGFNDGSIENFHSRRDFMVKYTPIVKNWECDINTRMITIENGEAYPIFCHREPRTPIEKYRLKNDWIICSRIHCAHCFDHICKLGGK